MFILKFRVVDQSFGIHGEKAIQCKVPWDEVGGEDQQYNGYSGYGDLRGGTQNQLFL